MSSPSQDNEELSSSNAMAQDEAGGSGGESASSEAPRPPAKRPLSTAVIEISDTDSDDSDVCAVSSYQASADEVKRIRGADNSSSSSSSDYSSDSESPWEDDSIVIKDEIVDIKPVNAQLNPRANRMDDPKLNPALKEQEIIENLGTHWKEMKDYTNDVVTLTCDPFRVCRLHGFLANPEIINNMVDDMNTLDWERKKMDLYEFHQTADLANLTWQRSIRGIYELLKTEVMSWVSAVTGLQLSSVSASCSLYGPGDHLLVHDDLLADRRVAFILYLAPWQPRPRPVPNGAQDHNHTQCDPPADGWTPSMGGALELLSRGAAAAAGGGVKAEGGAEAGTEGEAEAGAEGEAEARAGGEAEAGAGGEAEAGAGGEAEAEAEAGPEGEVEAGPTHVVRRIYPANNMLAFFKVGADSYHQVGEVLSLELPRLSINGWFHGPGPPPPPAPLPPPPPLQAPHNQPVVLQQWLEAAYMSPRARAQVQQQMERDSEVCLRDFLLPAAYQRLLVALKGPDVEWEAAGGAWQRCYSRVADAWLKRGAGGCGGAGGCEGASGGSGASGAPHAVRELVHVLSSAAFCRALGACTDLPLLHLRPPELRRLEPASFTLLPPRSYYSQPRLEALLYLGAPRRRLAGGGCTFVAPDDADADGALLTVPPANNALSLVYCDAGAAAFTKYLSRLAMRDAEPFYLIVCEYTD